MKIDGIFLHPIAIFLALMGALMLGCKASNRKGKNFSLHHSMNHADFLKLSYEEWVPYYLLVGDPSHCTYCGEKPAHRDHVIPRLTLFGTNESGYDFKGLVTPACASCNIQLGSLNFPLFLNRCELIRSRYEAHAERLKDSKTWTPAELATLDYSLEQHVKYKQNQPKRNRRSQLERKIEWQTTHTFRRVCRLMQKQTEKEHPALRHYLSFGLL